MNAIFLKKNLHNLQGLNTCYRNKKYVSTLQDSERKIGEHFYLNVFSKLKESLSTKLTKHM